MLGSDLGRVFYDWRPYLLDLDTINITNEKWRVIRYRTPKTQDDFDKIDEKDIYSLEERGEISTDELPELIRHLNPQLRDNILAFIAHYARGFEIFLFDNLAVSAHILAEALHKILSEEN